jgi:hypothetical protein
MVPMFVTVNLKTILNAKYVGVCKCQWSIYISQSNSNVPVVISKKNYRNFLQYHLVSSLHSFEIYLNWISRFFKHLSWIVLNSKSAVVITGPNSCVFPFPHVVGIDVAN